MPTIGSGSSGVSTTPPMTPRPPAPIASPVGSTVQYGSLGTSNVPSNSYALPYYGSGPASGELYNRLESRSTLAQQAPTRVYQGADNLIGQALPSFVDAAQSFVGGARTPPLQNVGLYTNFQGSGNLENASRGGIDYFGRIGLSEGVQNIMAQQNRANQSLTEQLGRNPGNSGLLAVLQNQNRMRSQLSMNPLLSEAQRGTYERAGQNIALENSAMQLANQARQAQTGFNNQNQLTQFQSQLQAMQPYQNLLELLSALQGQARGLQSNEGSFAGKNFQ